MPRSASSKRWLKQHHADGYVRNARRVGWRSRAAYKLLEIDRQVRLFRPGLQVVDLGAAPGGWSQVAIQKVGKSGRVIACDINAMEALDAVEFIQGDFRDPSVYEAILRLADKRAVDLVLSDMAPNLSGMPSIDQPRILDLAELAGEFARQVLRPGGDLLFKLFQGDGFEPCIAQLRNDFAALSVCKPPASRSRSRETYVLAQGYGV